MPRRRSSPAACSSGAAHRRGSTLGGAFQGGEQPAQVTGPVPGGQVVVDLAGEGDQPDRVALGEQEVGERRRQGGGVVRLGPPARAVAHRPAVVDEQVAAQVGLVLELLDVVAVGAGEEPPVEVAEVVAGAVLAVFGELDREAVVGAAVQAAPQPLDHAARAQLQRVIRISAARSMPPRPGSGAGPLRSCPPGCCSSPDAPRLTCHCYSPGTASSSRSITVSTVTPSASAR